MQLMDEGMTLRKRDDTAEKVKLRKKYNRRKTLLWLGYGGLIAVTIWLITDMVLDYFSHLGEDEPLFP
jgi:hypothetical protein